MFANPAFAQIASSADGAGNALTSMLPLVLIFVVFYFLLVRPQQKKAKQHREMLAALRRGDRVVVSGIIGTVAKVTSDTEVSVEIADGTRVRVMRASITDVLAKTEPVGAKPEIEESNGDAAAPGVEAGEAASPAPKRTRKPANKP